MNCGNMNMKKALSLNPNMERGMPSDKSEEKTANKPLEKTIKKEAKEITITSDEVDINYS